MNDYLNVHTKTSILINILYPDIVWLLIDTEICCHGINTICVEMSIMMLLMA